MNPFVRTICLLGAFPTFGAFLVLQEPAKPALQWPLGPYLDCARRTSSATDSFSSSVRIRSYDASGRPKELVRTSLDRGSLADTLEQAIEWTSELPIESWWKTGHVYSFPARVHTRQVSSSGFQRRDTLASTWNPITRSLVYTSTSPLDSRYCGWTDSLVFDAELRLQTQTTCEPGSWNSTRKTTRFHYLGTARLPVSSATRWNLAEDDLDSVWREGPAGTPSRESFRGARKSEALSGATYVRLEVTDFQYDADGRIVQIQSSLRLDTVLSSWSHTWISYAPDGLRQRTEGWEVTLQSVRDSLWGSTTCANRPASLRIRAGEGALDPAGIRFADGIWHLASREPVAGPVEWISARGTRRVVAVPASQREVRLDLPRGTGPGWIRFRSDAGVTTLPAPVIAP